jgi:hypothetical protein
MPKVTSSHTHPGAAQISAENALTQASAINTTLGCENMIRRRISRPREARPSARDERLV